MNKTTITLFILGLIILTICFYSLKQATGQSDTNPPDKQSVLITGEGGVPTSVTVTGEWEDNTVEMRATVRKSECQSCKDYMDITDCQKYFNLCEDVK